MRSARYKVRAQHRGGVRSGVILCGAVLIAASGCSTLRVESLRSPGADFTGRSTFRVLEEPAEGATIRLISLQDRDVGTVETISTAVPMLNNSIIDEMARDDVARAFEARGYRMTNTDADLDVAFYVQAREKLEVDAYRGPYGYRRGYVEERTEGIVVIDVIDPDTDRLLWRGTGEMTVSEDPDDYADQLSEAIHKIVRRFPAVRVPEGTQL